MYRCVKVFENLITPHTCVVKMGVLIKDFKITQELVAIIGVLLLSSG